MHKASIYIWFKYDLGQKYYTPQVWPNQDSNSWPPDHDSTFHVTDTLGLTTRSSVTSIIYTYFYDLSLGGNMRSTEFPEDEFLGRYSGGDHSQQVS